MVLIRQVILMLLLFCGAGSTANSQDSWGSGASDDWVDDTEAEVAAEDLVEYAFGVAFAGPYAGGLSGPRDYDGFFPFEVPEAPYLLVEAQKVDYQVMLSPQKLPIKVRAMAIFDQQEFAMRVKKHIVRTNLQRFSNTRLVKNEPFHTVIAAGDYYIAVTFFKPAILRYSFINNSRMKLEIERQKMDQRLKQQLAKEKFQRLLQDKDTGVEVEVAPR